MAGIKHVRYEPLEIENKANNEPAESEYGNRMWAGKNIPSRIVELAEEQ